MQKVQDSLDFKIDTPTDEELDHRFNQEVAEVLGLTFNSEKDGGIRRHGKRTKNQLKRDRKKALV